MAVPTRTTVPSSRKLATQWNDAGTLRHTAPISLGIELTQPLALAVPAPKPIAGRQTSANAIGLG